ncbi:MAG TPA: amidohydrolase family protein [Acidimicrobiia bacterium]|nr:amidohydrolase family protein [Acidimicrobiia bacterium]
MTADVVIKGGTVIDGTGAPGRRADVAITGGVVTDIGEGLSGTKELDAAGHTVTPGFIDIHTHYDAQVFWDPALSPSCWHGVTSVVAGNCGFSIAPVKAEHRELLVNTLQHVEDMAPDTLFAGVPWESFETFPQYLDAIEARGTLLNYACYVGHTAVRIYVMGEAGYERAATDDEIAGMQRVIAESMAAGAAGFATSSSPTHSGDRGRPVPSRVADITELNALLEPLRDARKGVAALLPGEKITHADVYGIQKGIGRPLTWTALLTVKDFPWHEKIMEANTAARAEGIEVWPQVSCRPLTFQMNLREPFTFNMRPAFQELMDAPIETRIAAYRDPAWRAKAWEQLSGPARGLGSNFDSLSVAESSAHPELVGRRVVDIAEERGGTPFDAMLDVSLDENLETRFSSVLANNDPDAIAWLLPQETVLLGLADSGAHVSQLCDACFSTDLLGNWVREKEVMPLERAIYKLTGEPAGVFGLADRGTLEVGKAADVVVFDADTVAPGPLRRIRDFPADGERLVADQPQGMRHVVVNGTVIREDEQEVAGALESRPGKLLRS